jgi:glycosyltransferase involved in cell wall biosynthesis
MSLHLMGMNPLEQYVYRHADLIYYRNEKCADVLVARGCPRDKLNGPMPNGVSMCTFAPPDVKSIREFKASYPSSFTRSTSPRVGYAGRIARQKGIHLLLKVAERHPKIQFGFCGTQVDGSLVERISATPNATYFGRLDTGNLISFYGLSDVLLLPSIPTEKWEEQFGRVLTEAIACGTPAAGSDVGMISDIVGTEAVFPPDEVEALEEKVLSLTQPRAARALYRRQKSRLQDHYTWDVVAERVCNDTDVLLRLRNR